MSEDRWRKLQTLFHTALELPPETRQAFIDRETGDDPDLRLELAEMVAHADAGSSLIAGAIGKVAADMSSSGVWVGRRIGPYRLIREIGRGGMGVVYEARRDDDEYLKTVALKLATRRRDRADLAERFRNERQILAGLEHPNIARFLDGGSEGGVSYFAMEYVEGSPITVYAQRHGLNLRQRIELFRQVCSAVHHAHQSLVVHRDLKPGNILVSEPSGGVPGTPKLLDFGIAKLLSPLEENSKDTRTGFALWTPDYASPEQVRAFPITTRTDVYSLGLVLFELLTGERGQTADTASPLALDRSVCETPIPLPSSKAPRSLARLMAGDLDTIIAKATQKEPQRRYNSVEEFSEDLRRYLEGLPIRARKDSAAYRASKFLRRNWLTMSAASLAALGLVVGAAGFAWQARVANHSRAIAEQQRDRAEREHGMAQEQRDTARREQARAEDLAREAGLQRQRAEQRTSEMVGFAQHAIFDLYASIERLPGSMEARRAMLQSTLSYLERLRTEAGEDPEFLRLLGETYMEVGDIQGNPERPSLGDLPGALENYRKSIEILTPLVASNPAKASFRISLVGPHLRLGRALRSSGKVPEALEIDRKGVQAARAAVATAPGDPKAALQLGLMAEELSRALVADEPDKAEPYAKESLEIYRGLAAKDPGNGDLLDDMASVYSILSSAASRRHDPSATYEYVRRGTEIRERLTKLRPDDVTLQRNLLISYGRLGDILGYAYENLGDRTGALEAFGKCIAVAKQMLAKDPRSQTAQSDLATAESRAGQTLLYLGRTAEAIEVQSRAVSGFEALVKAAPTNLGWRQLAGTALVCLADSLRAAGQFEKAMDISKHATEVLSAPGGEENTLIQGQLASSRQLTASMLAERGDRAAALEETARATEILRKQGARVALSFVGSFAKYWNRVGETYVLLARLKNASTDHALSDWRAAKAAYERSIGEWRLNRGAGAKEELTRLEARLSECNAAIARLTN